MNLKKQSTRILALLLCLSMLLISPITTSAVVDDITSQNDAPSTERAVSEDGLTADSIAVPETAVNYEVEYLREENAKHFYMGDGNYQAISYSHPVHELDSDGNWQNVDFSMHLTQTRGTRVYANTSGITLAESYVANRPLVTIADNSIAMSLVPNNNTSVTRAVSADPIHAQRTANATTIETYTDAQEAFFSNTLLYENVMPGIDLEYIVDPWTVKENIIVKQPSARYAYTFKLTLSNYYPVLEADGSVSLLNMQTEEKEYLIPPPYMFDAYGEMSFDVSYTVTGNNGIYYLTVTADSTWINAEDRLFPVTIDPTMYLANQSVNMDTYINEDTPNEPRGLYKFFFVGENEVAYLYMDTPELPSNSTLTSATLDLYYFYKDHITSGYVDFTAHRVTDFYWAQESLTWNNVIANGYSQTFGLASTAEGVFRRVFASAGATSASPKPVSVTITDAVRLWVNGTTNKGIGLKFVEGCPNYSVMFRSTEGPVTYRPKLVYKYEVSDSVNLEVKYDNAYSTYYGDTLTRISNELKELSKFFYDKFDILINYNISDVYNFISYSDNCPNKINNICNCEAHECANLSNAWQYELNHHTNISANLYSLGVSAPTYVTIAFLGPTLCSLGTDGVCHPTGPLGGVKGLSDYTTSTMIIFNNSPIEQAETVTLIHEMGHMFGADDHYQTRTGIPEIDNCLYGFSGVNCTDPQNIFLCAECHDTIVENHGRYND